MIQWKAFFGPFSWISSIFIGMEFGLVQVPAFRTLIDILGSLNYWSPALLYCYFISIISLVSTCLTIDSEG
jgi:hypothetical protein